MTAASPRGNAGTVGFALLGLAAYVLLHYADPDLPVTWSFAHLHRRAHLPWLGGALLVLLPVLATLAWRQPFLERPVAAVSPIRVAFFLLGLFVLTLACTIWFPHQPHAIDSTEFILGATQPGFRYGARWYLSLHVYRRIASAFVPPLAPEAFARGANAFVGAVALTALAGCARLLARGRGEALAITLLVWSSMGVMQISIGYLDIYPVPLALTAVYLWLALRVLAGRTHIVWPMLLLGIGPFFYIGVILLAPSALLLVYEVAGRPGGVRRIVGSGLLSLGAAIAATIPGYGRPLAWATWYGEAAEASSCHWGLSPESCLLPLDYILSGEHLGEMAHLLLLVDGIGLLLCVIFTVPLLLRRAWKIDLRILLLGVIAAGHFAFLLLLDPLFGQYSDWDAYTYPALSVSFLGAWGFVIWGRKNPRLFGPLLGFALAAAGIHLLARLNAMHVDYHRHITETPCHVNCGPPGTYYESCRECSWDGLLLLCECRTRDGHWRRTAALRRCPSGLFNDDGVLRCE